MNMDKTIVNLPVFRETRFRNPSPYERQIGFWVDRIGSARDDGKNSPPGLRILGQYAVVMVESGEGIFITQTRGAHAVKSGDAFLLVPEEPTRYGPDKTWLTRWIVWNGPLARQQADVAGINPANPVFRQAAEVVRQAFFALFKLMDIEDRAAVLERQAVILNMLAGLIRNQHSRTFQGNSEPDWKAVVQYIRRNLNSSLPPAELAAMTHWSVPHFRRMFRRHVGRSPVEFILSERVSRAKDLLVRGASIKQAAGETGFADQFYFMRVFKKITGQTAGQFIGAAHCRKNRPSDMRSK